MQGLRRQFEGVRPGLREVVEAVSGLRGAFDLRFVAARANVYVLLQEQEVLTPL